VRFTILMFLVATSLGPSSAQQKTANNFRSLKTGNSLELSFMPIDDKGNPLNSFVSVVAPQFPGGFDSLARFYSRNLRYPESAVHDNVSGKVRVIFEIDKTGNVSDVHIAKGVREDLDAVCIRAVSMLPKWRPAHYETGTSVACQVIQPLRFVLPPNETRKSKGGEQGSSK
jgi:TonB family protein